MSYDIRMFLLKPGADIEFVAHADEPEPGQPDGRGLVDMSPALREGIAQAIAAITPAPERISDEAKFEFNWPLEGLQATVLDNEVAVTLAYWHRGPKAREIVSRMLSIVEECTRRGLTGYDHQVGRAVVGVGDIEDVMRVYQRGVDAVKGVAASGAEGTAARRWWKFW